MCVYHVTCVQVKEQLAGDGLFFPSCGLWGSNSGLQRWGQVPLYLSCFAACEETALQSLVYVHYFIIPER